MLVIKIRKALDSIVDCLQNTTEKLGHNGYLLYGICSNTLFFGASMMVKYYTNIDWTFCVISRGLVTFVLSYILSITHNVDITFPGSELKLLTMRNVIMSI
jgi:hypothetical protein